MSRKKSQNLYDDDDDIKTSFHDGCNKAALKIFLPIHFGMIFVKSIKLQNKLNCDGKSLRHNQNIMCTNMTQ